ncbi:TPA: hypothetical protein NJU89_002974 [Clostridium perfringens]|nr:hypothetical protein [Clostridium perfringens]
MYICSCEKENIQPRYVNYGCEEGENYIKVYDKVKKEFFLIEMIEVNSFSNNGYDEVYFCKSCGKSGYSNYFKNL